jgi:hypothetical protein
MGNLCCAREHSVQFLVQFFYTVKLHSLTQGVWGPLGYMGPFRVYGALKGVWGPLGCMGPFTVCVTASTERSLLQNLANYVMISLKKLKYLSTQC